MVSENLLELIKRADLLSTADQLRLIAHLAQRTANTVGGERRYSWLELEGAAPYPLVGEDAQAWVSRTRREADEARARQWTQPECE